MQIRFGFTTNNIPGISNIMQRFLVALLKDGLHHSGNFENSKKHLKAYCESENINYQALEYNLGLFFRLFQDYCQANTFVLYGLLKSQARFCFIDEEMFGFLQIAAPEQDCDEDNRYASAYNHQPGKSRLSVHHSALVGGHLIGL